MPVVRRPVSNKVALAEFAAPVRKAAEQQKESQGRMSEVEKGFAIAGLSVLALAIVVALGDPWNPIVPVLMVTGVLLCLAGFLVCIVQS